MIGYLCSPILKFVNKDTVKNNSLKTTIVTPADVKRTWYVVDAENQTLGRLSSNIAKVLQGKNKPSYMAHIDTGDHVIVINAEKIVLTGKKVTQKTYMRHTGYPGGERFMTPKEALVKKPEFIIENAVKHMLPRTRLGRAMYKKLHVYAGTVHPHAGQNPQVLKF